MLCPFFPEAQAGQGSAAAVIFFELQGCDHDRPVFQSDLAFVKGRHFLPHSGKSRNPEKSTHWTPACAGVTAYSAFAAVNSRSG
jgi:hypothetical protein